MVRWRLCLFLAMLLILPDRGLSKSDDEEEETRVEDPEEEEEDDDDDDDDTPATQRVERPQAAVLGRRAPATVRVTSTTSDVVTRTAPRRPLECYVCAYKAETQLRSCLDPTKYRVHTMICHSPDDKCFTSVISKGNSYEAVMRGCRSGCVPSPETTCCELNRCNNQALAIPTLQPHALTQVKDKSSKTIPPSVLFFVTILLVLQTVVKVAFV